MDTVNVFAPELRKVIRKEVPFLKGAWVDFYDDVTIDVISKAQASEGNIDLNLDIVCNQIAEWNFADQDSIILPVNVQSLKKLPLKLLQWISSQEQEILKDMAIADEDKKKE